MPRVGPEQEEEETNEENEEEEEEEEEEKEQIKTDKSFKSDECVICLTNPPNVLFCNAVIYLYALNVKKRKR